MNLKGKFVRREGTLLIFGSQKKPEWKPIEASGHIDPTHLHPGSYYELNVDDNRLHSFTQLAPAQPQRGHDGTSQAPGPTPRGGGDNVPRNGLMASATGVLKSLLEAGETYQNAEPLALRWASLWGDAPRTEPPAPPPQVQQAQGQWDSPNSYSNSPPARDPDEPPF